MAEFKKFMENTDLRTGINIAGDTFGYNLQIMQYSNKGPLIIVTHPETKQEIARARFDLLTNKWATKTDF